MKAHRGQQKDRRKAHYRGLFQRFLRLERRVTRDPDTEAEKVRLGVEQGGLPYHDWAMHASYEEARRRLPCYYLD